MVAQRQYYLPDCVHVSNVLLLRLVRKVTLNCWRPCRPGCCMQVLAS